MDMRCTVVILLVFLAGVDTCLRRADIGSFWGKKEIDDTSPKPFKPTKPTKTKPSKPTTTKPSQPADEDKLWECGVCGSPIDVTLHVENNLTEPFFNDSIYLEGVNQRELFHLLVQAANQNVTKFRFSMTHYGAELGFMIDSINGLKHEWVGDTLRYWRIFFGNDTALELGVSNYIPQDEEEFIFRYVTWQPKNTTLG